MLNQFSIALADINGDDGDLGRQDWGTKQQCQGNGLCWQKLVSFVTHTQP